mmetsp:Transcript_8192/g.24373  ORF Transcript_8192/g.24373 Transcript_8192/m.24373 type:complete len:202 (+) Transcript_8192:702-1307(+)
MPRTTAAGWSCASMTRPLRRRPPCSPTNRRSIRASTHDRSFTPTSSHSQVSLVGQHSATVSSGTSNNSSNNRSNTHRTSTTSPVSCSRGCHREEAPPCGGVPRAAGRWRSRAGTTACGSSRPGLQSRRCNRITGITAGSHRPPLRQWYPPRSQQGVAGQFWTAWAHALVALPLRRRHPLTQKHRLEPPETPQGEGWLFRAA